jgi:hypothetical protein
MTREFISREPYRLGQFLLAALLNFCAVRTGYPQWFGVIQADSLLDQGPGL